MYVGGLGEAGREDTRNGFHLFGSRLWNMTSSPTIRTPPTPPVRSVRACAELFWADMGGKGANREGAERAERRPHSPRLAGSLNPLPAACCPSSTATPVRSDDGYQPWRIILVGTAVTHPREEFGRAGRATGQSYGLPNMRPQRRHSSKTGRFHRRRTAPSVCLGFMARNAATSRQPARGIHSVSLVVFPGHANLVSGRRHRRARRSRSPSPHESLIRSRPLEPMPRPVARSLASPEPTRACPFHATVIGAGPYSPYPAEDGQCLSGPSSSNKSHQQTWGYRLLAGGG